MPTHKSVVSFNFSEFLEENVKELTNQMTWMEGRSFRCAESIEEVRDFVDKAILAGLCAVDLETTGLNTRTKRTATSQKAPIEKIVSFGLCYDPKIGIHIPINHIDGAEFNLDENLVFKEIQRLCAHCVTIYHNAKFDLSFLRNYGIIVSDFKMFEDTQLLARLYDAGQKDTKLKHISERLINQPMIEYNEIAPEGKFQLISPKIGYIYGASDPMCTLDLYRFFMGQQIIIDQKSIYNLEKRVVFVVMEIESNLIKIDVPYLEKLRIEASARIKLIEQEIQTLAGEEFNVGSTQQLGKILFEKMKYRYPEKEKTASGQYKTDDKTLEKIADEFPIVKKLMEFRGLQKSLGTYIENLLNNHDEDGYVKIGFHQSGTDTGRFSSPGGMGIKEDGYSGVNVQSIPKDTEGGMPDLRKAFVARPGYKLVAADYENEEMRVATNLSNETAWIEAVNAGVDFHTKTASIISGKPIDQVQKSDRKTGKTVNFLALYLGGPMSLAAQAKISMVEAKRILADYFRGVPNLKKWMDVTIAHARKHKYVKTNFGRTRPLAVFYESGDRGQEAHGDRCAVNTKIQGCLQGHVRCLTSMGYLSILKIRDLKSKNVNLKIWSGTSWEDFDVVDRGPAQLAKIELENGMYLDIDTRHEMLVEEEDGYKFKKFDEIGTGTRICLSVPTIKEFGEYPPPFKFIGKSHNSIPVTIDKNEDWIEASYFLGCLIGDGYVTVIEEKSFNSINFCFGASKVKEIYPRLKRFVESIGANISEPIPSPSSIGESYRITVYSKGFVHLMNSMGYCYTNALDKKVPESMYGAPLAMRKSFLNGYYVTDGSKTEGNRHCFHTPNKELLQGIQILSWTMGCSSKIFPDKEGNYTLHWTDIWAIEDVLGIKDRIRKRRCNSDQYPLPKFLYHIVSECMTGTAYAKSTTDRAYLWKVRHGKKVAIPGIISLLGKYNKSFPEIYYSSPLRNKIVEDRVENTYTLAVHSPLHRFDSSVIISKNTCADVMKTVMVRVYNWIHTNNLHEDIRVLLTMHDELVFEIKEDKLDFYVPKLTKIMGLSDLLQDTLKWPLPLTVDVKYGDSWRMKKKFYEDFPELKERVNDSLDFHYSSQSTTNRYAIALGKTSEPDIVGELVTAPVAVPEPIPVSEPLAIPEPTPVSEPLAIPEPTPVSEPIKEPVSLPELSSEPVQAISLPESVQPVTVDSTSSEPLKAIVPDIDMNDILSSLAPSAKTDVSVSSQESKPAENQIVMPEVSQINQSDEDFVYIVRDLKKTTSRRLNDILLFLVDEKRCESYQSPRKTLQIRDEQGHSLNVSEYKVPVDVFLALARYFGI